jgi:hypothetical protein
MAVDNHKNVEDMAYVGPISEDVQTSTAQVQTPLKEKHWVEPTISSPVDILEATAFFQTATSGSTN